MICPCRGHDEMCPCQNQVKGHARGRKKGVPIYFDPDQIAAINAWRGSNNTNFSEAVRTLVEWGLESAQESSKP